MLTYKSNGGAVGDGTRITRISTDDNGDQHFAVMVDEKTERFSEVVGCIGEVAPPVEPETPPIIQPDPDPPTDPTPPDTGAWHDAVWATRDGTGLGADTKAKIPARQWAANVGLPISGTTLTVNRDNVTDRDIDFSGLSVYWRGVGADLTNCLFDVEANPGNRTIAYFARGASLIDTTFDNSKTMRPMVMVKFDAPTGDVATVKGCRFIKPSTDPIKGPRGGRLHVEDVSFEGSYVTQDSHLDYIDMRGAGAGSIIRRAVFLGDYAGVAPGNGTGMNNLARCADNYLAQGHTYEQCIFVGSNHPLTDSILLSPGKSASTGINFRECLIDMREHNTLINSNSAVNEWDVHEFDASTGDVGSRIHIPNAAITP